MQGYLLVACFHQMQNDVTSILTCTFSIAKPLVTSLGRASDYSLRVMNPTVSACMRRKIVEIIWLYCFKISAAS